MRRIKRCTLSTLIPCLCSIAVAGLLAVGCQHATSDDGGSNDGSSQAQVPDDDGDSNSGKADRSGPSTYDPCGGKSCGDRCTKCPPNDSDCVETAVIKYCQPDGTCEATQPTCNSSSGCTSNVDCGKDEYCKKTGSKVCSAQTRGTCTEKPEACTLEYNPVCGCDGKTYGNACKAHSSGVNVAHDGECGSNDGNYDPCGGKSCGDRCTKCPPNDPGCVETSVIKYCQPDGSCSAHQPKCSGSKGCTSNSECGNDAFCEKEGSNACSNNTAGSCNQKPEVCPLYYNPVCGCDGKTYSNSCLARHAGVNVAHDGSC